MKKVYLGLLTISLTAMLAACGTSNSDYVIKEGEPVADEKFMQANYNQNELEEAVKYESYQVEAPEGYTFVTTNYSKGYASIRKDGKYGVYSFFAKKIILDARLATAPVFSYNENEVFGFDFIYQEPSNEKYYLADGVGNILYESKDTFSFYGSNYTTWTNRKTKQKTLYSVYTIFDENVGDDYFAKYFKYDKDNVATECTYKEYGNFEETAPGQSAESVDYVVDLKEYGLDKTMKVFNNEYNGYVIKVYGNDGAELASFRLETFAKYFHLGKRVYTQLVNGADGLRKAETTYIDLETLEQKSFDLPAKIEKTYELESPLNDGKNYFAIELTEIKDGRFGFNRTMIFDSEGKFHDDITKKNFVQWKRLASGYFYDESGSVLYDEGFSPVLHLDIDSSEFNEKYEVFLRYNDIGYREFIDNRGKYIFSGKFVYNSYYNDGVYRGTDLELNKSICLNVRDGSTVYLATDSGKGTYAEEDTFIGSEDRFIQRVCRTYEDDEGERGAEISSKRKGSLRTIDGQELININSHFGGSFNMASPYAPSVYSGKVGPRFYYLSYSVNSETARSYVYNQLYTAKSIEAPAA